MLLKKNSVFIFIFIMIFNLIRNEPIRNLVRTKPMGHHKAYSVDDDSSFGGWDSGDTIIVIVIIVIFVVIVIIYFVCCHNKRKARKTTEQNETNIGHPQGYYTYPVNQTNPTQSDQNINAVPQQNNVQNNNNKISNINNSNQLLNLNNQPNNNSNTNDELVKINYLFQFIMIPEIYNERLQNLESKCNICLKNFILKKSKIVETKCHHIFHFYCLKKCLLNAAEKKCPNCNYDFLSLFTSAINLKTNEIKIEPLDERDNPNNES